MDNYWDTKTALADGSSVPGTAGYRRSQLAKKFISEKLERNSQPILLDCGCGTGASLQVLSPLFYKAFGTDFSDRMLERASGKSFPDGRVEFFKWDLSEPFPIAGDRWQKVQALTLFSVLPYVEDWGFFFKEIRKVLAPGGIFLSTFPNVLFDLYSLNTFSERFFQNELLDATLSYNLKTFAIGELQQVFSKRVPHFGKESAYSSKGICFKRSNPLTIREELAGYGVQVEELFFMNNHPVPPSFDIFKTSEIEAIRREREQDLDFKHWTQYFTNSTFMVAGSLV